jgi:hypothetical protein
MRSPITFVAALLAALLCAAPALAGKPKRSVTTTTVTATAAISPAPTALPRTRTLALRTDGRIPMGFNGSYSLSKIWSSPMGFAPWVDTHAIAERAAGATVARTPLYWDGVEGQRGVRSWATYDAIVKADWFQGIKPILLISGAPSWASAGCTSTCVPDDAHLADFQGFVQAVVARYGSLIAGVEIYNEPNLAWYWGSAADPERYVRVLCAGYDGERAAEKAGTAHVPVAGGALSDNQTTSGGNLSLADYLKRLFAAGGAKCMDALSFHDYPGGSNLGAHFSTALAQVRTRRDAAAPGLPLWITETGLSLTQPGITETMRATTLPAVYRAVAAMPDVDVVIFHTLVQVSGTPNYGLGTIAADAAGQPQFAPTPTYGALKAELAAGR